MRGARRESESGFYHVITRGVGRCLIFEDDADRRKYLSLLDDALIRFSIELYAWCLMDNHVHLLVGSELESLSCAMKYVDSAYAQYFNERHDRVGHLFQGRFKSEPVSSDEYFLVALRYIHQNPLKAGMAKTCDYQWSSYREYIEGSIRTNTAFALALFGGVSSFMTFHQQIDFAAACIEDGGGRQRRGNDEVLIAAREILSPVRPEEVCGLGREGRDAALRKLKAARMSVRQIERMTGVPKSVVSRA